MKVQQQVYVVVLSLFLALTKAQQLDETFELASSKTPNVCKSQFNGTILPHPEDCQKFYVCGNHKAQEYNCDPNFHFDSLTLSCVAGSECSSAVAPPPSCVDGEINALDKDCYSFEICVKGQYQKINCPVNYYYHVPQSICVPLVFNAQFKCSCILPEHTVVANANNCETYFKCEGKTSVLEKCPLGQYYNSTINSCITDLEGICITEPTKTPTVLTKEEEIHKEDTTDARELCARLGVKKIQFQTFAEGCNRFHICVNGILHTQNCPQGFYYDGNKKYCVVDVENKCKDQKEESVPEIKQKVNMAAEIVEIPVPKTPELAQPKPIFKEPETNFIQPSQQPNKLFSKFMKF